MFAIGMGPPNSYKAKSKPNLLLRNILQQYETNHYQKRQEK